MPIQDRIAARKMSAMLPLPPRVARTLAVSGSCSANWTMSWAMPPKDRPATAAGSPADQGAALRAPGQAERAAQPGRRRGQAQPGRQRPGAHVTPGEQGGHGHQQDQQQGHGQEQDRPALAGERLEPLRPPDRRQPRQPRQAGGRVARRGAGRRGRARRRPSRWPPGVLGQLDGDGRDAGEDEAVEADADGQGDRPGGQGGPWPRIRPRSGRPARR